MLELKGRDGEVCHLVISPKDFPGHGERVDLISPGNFLQLALISADGGASFRAHRHLERFRTFSNLRAQEAWVVLSGTVSVEYSDEDDNPLQTVELSPGDISISLRGGHGYVILEDARVLEFKSGPYEGLEVDKVFI